MFQIEYMPKTEKERILVTSALPYANGPLHIGHAIGAYIPADVYTRYHRLKGNDVVYICGTDEHGTPIAVAAEREGVTARKVVDKYHGMIEKAFSDLGISFDNFSRTTKDLHYKMSQDFFLRIMEEGFIYKKTVERPYCGKCMRFLPDRYVKGTCPHCGAEEQRGDQCEVCGKQLEPHELIDSYCTLCHGIPGMKETEHCFFKLSEFNDRLKDWISENKHWPDNCRNFSLGWLKEGLQDRAITRDLDWGIPVPVKGSEGKVLYVWFDAPIGYISSTIEWAQKTDKPREWEKYWKDKKCRIVHFIGKDNIPFHAIIWPAMLMAHKNYNLPWQISSNEYLTLEGSKMSTSRGWVLWLHDVLSEFPPDYLRYYLLSINPARHDTDFSLEEFQHKVNSELLAALGNFIYRTMSFLRDKKGGVVPKPGDLKEIDNELIDAINKAVEDTGRNIEEFRFSQALSSMMALVHHGNEYFQHKEPWKTENDTTLHLCINLVRTISIIMYPLLPHSAESVWEMLNLKGTVGDDGWDSAAELSIGAGHKIAEIKPLYEKIEDEKIEAFTDKYLKLKTKMEDIKFDEFKRMDIRVAEIKEVSDHPKADRLYLLKVDLGDLGERQLVAGIKENYRKEELVGRQVVVITNLEPTHIRGVKSEGMILAADAKGEPILLAPEKKTKPGAKIR